jgi:glutamate--cysteine ligase
MYFVVRKNKYIDCSGKSFSDFLEGKLDIMPGEKPTIQDWENHLSTIFTEVRLKRIIEVRGADAGNWRRTCALPAFWVGILYGENSIGLAERICDKWTADDIENLSNNVAKKGLDAEIHGKKVLDVAKDLLEISRSGLINRNVKDAIGNNESIYLNVLEEIVQTKNSPAKELAKNFTQKYNHSMQELLKDIAY